MKTYESLSERLRRQHETLIPILLDADTVRIHNNPLPDKWSIHDNIAHLAKYQPLFRERIQRILTEDTPVFGRYKAEEDKDFETWRRKNTTILLDELTTFRHELSDFIISIPDEESYRKGIHPKYGELNIEQWTEFFLLHEAHHLFTIFQLAHNTD